MGDADVSGIPRIGQNGEIDMEKLAEIRPDAVIGNGDADGWSWFDDDVNAQLTGVAPFIPLPATGDIDTKIADTREIADFLGADVTADSIVRADADLESAKREFRDAVSGKDLNFLLASPTKEILYTGVGFAQADLLAELGATIVGAEAPATGNPWGQVAWEDASTYPADVILVEGYDPENPFSAELWDDLPAVKARQLSGWYSKGALTSRNYADWLGGLAERARGYTKVS
ncbi:ABC transporter substrate-binding protein [Corynebacterium pacaense]|uniref:ABC transporter substrate-binding protein n=1 Tax=Corynebacterium pacaense TaxID=1816684 RepID=UPI001FE8CC7A|nr:ABC transporter substrate-binding protein [Corynebacterium pacaense]